MYCCTTKNLEERQNHFVCSTSRKNGKDVCGMRFIRAKVLKMGVLRFQQILLWCISDCEDLFREKLGAKRREDFKRSYPQNEGRSLGHSAGLRNLTAFLSVSTRITHRARLPTADFKSCPEIMSLSKLN